MSAFTLQKYGPCEVLFNNAGIHVSGALHETSAADWDRIMNVDLRGVYLVCYHFLPQMLEAKYGTIINMASVSGVLADTSMAAYNAAKGAIVNLTRAMALDYAAQEHPGQRCLPRGDQDRHPGEHFRSRAGRGGEVHRRLSHAFDRRSDRSGESLRFSGIAEKPISSTAR